MGLSGELERRSGWVLHSRLNHVEWFRIDPDCDEKPQPNFYQRNEVIRDGAGSAPMTGWGCGR